MSIITEALTKAQEKRKSYGKVEAKVEPKILEQRIEKEQAIPLKETKPIFNIKSIVTLGIILAVLAAFMNFLPLMRKAKPQLAQLPSAQTPAAQTSQAPAVQAPAYKFNLSSPLFKFNLEGIVSGNGPTLAIINNELLGVGDTIKGATVVEIKEAENEVILDYNGEEVLLQLR